MFTAALADKLIRALPVIEGVPLGSKRYEIIPNVLDSQEDSTALNRQRVRPVSSPGKSQTGVSSGTGTPEPALPQASPGHDAGVCRRHRRELLV